MRVRPSLKLCPKCLNLAPAPWPDPWELYGVETTFLRPNSELKLNP